MFQISCKCPGECVDESATWHNLAKSSKEGLGTEGGAEEQEGGRSANNTSRDGLQFSSLDAAIPH